MSESDGFRLIKWWVSQLPLPAGHSYENAAARDLVAKSTNTMTNISRLLCNEICRP